MFSLLDIILVVIFSGFVFYGLFFGFIRTLGVFVSAVASIYIAGLLNPLVFKLVEKYFHNNIAIGKLIVYFLVFVLVNKIIGLVFALVEQVFEAIAFIPFLKTINRLAGAALGFVAGGLLIGLLMQFFIDNAIFTALFKGMMQESKFVPYFLVFLKMVLNISFLRELNLGDLQKKLLEN